MAGQPQTPGNADDPPPSPTDLASTCEPAADPLAFCRYEELARREDRQRQSKTNRPTGETPAPSDHEIYKKSRSPKAPAAGRWKLVLFIMAAPPLAYLLAALAGALIPANPGWRPPRQGISVFVHTNGVHTSIVLPAAAAGIDWRPLIRAEHLPRPDLAGDYLAIGWGQREFYLKTPTWADLRPGVALRALFGRGGTLLHVEHLRQPPTGCDSRHILVTPDQYRRLTRYILNSFHRLPDGRAVPVRGRFAVESYYEARGSYDLFRTSNEWTGAALRTAGIRVGIWTPFAQSVLASFPGDAGSSVASGGDSGRCP